MDNFIDTVRRYPCLWNTTAIEYRDQELKDAAWAEVMKETDLCSVKEVKLKWKKLRDSYRDALKRQSELLAREPGGAGVAGGTGGAVKRGYPWKYMESMQFLQPHMSARKKPAEWPPATAAAPPAAGAAPGNGAGGGDRSGSSSSSDSDSSCPKRASLQRLAVMDRKLDFLCQVQRRGGGGACPSLAESPPVPAPSPSSDPLDTFFRGMCQSTRRLPLAAQLRVKRTLFEAVTAAEEAAVADQRTFAGLWGGGGGDAGEGEGGGSSDSSEDDGGGEGVD